MILNDPRKGEVFERYKGYPGRNKDQLQVLVADGRIPLGIAGIMQRRVEVLESNDAKLIASWTDERIDSGDVCLTHPDGRFKIVSDGYSLFLSKKRFFRGGAPLGLTFEESISFYEQQKGDEFMRSSLLKGMRKEEVKEHPVWQSLSSHNPELLDLYVDAVFGKQHRLPMMGICVPPSKKMSYARFWNIDAFFDGSNAEGNYVTVPYGNLIGSYRTTTDYINSILSHPSLKQQKRR